MIKIYNAYNDDKKYRYDNVITKKGTNRIAEQLLNKERNIQPVLQQPGKKLGKRNDNPHNQETEVNPKRWR